MPDTKTIKMKGLETSEPLELPPKLREAHKEFEALKKEIAPFVRKKTNTEQPSEGEWCETTHLYFIDPE